ncbi:AAA family ATPase [Nocardia aurea]|uniref:AAA family ATPase n=1 Tax=Nocardia aurea TaxID=2144174 RepID=A0ABV3G5F4_9NOCA
MAWLDGAAALDLGNRPRAADAFRAAIERDGAAADAWLGLHAAGGDRLDALKAMARNRASFGALRAKFRRRLSSRFDLGVYVDYRLESDHDLWLAIVAQLIHDGNLDAAAELLTPADQQEEVRFLRTRHAFLRKDWRLVLKSAHGINDRYMADESQLYVAMALIQQGVCAEAMQVLTPLPRIMTAVPNFVGELHFCRGLAYEGLEQPQRALRQFQSAYRFNPDLPGLAERIAVEQPPEVSVPETNATAAEPTAAHAAVSGEGDREDILAEAMRRLEGMVGLDPVKHEVRMLAAQLAMSLVRQAHGIPAAPVLRHFVFTGPPGTGKTTVARIVGQIFAGLGLLERGHVVETQRVDLVGRHLGETAIKTTGVIDSALDGVLFIDEAYSLANNGYTNGDAFGAEALQVLLKRAEDDRLRLVVVLAGYPDEMAEMLATNPGLASRFTTRVDFPPYNAQELVAIATNLLGERGENLDEASARVLAESCEHAVTHGHIDRLGNGRFVRELCAKAAALRDVRLVSLSSGSERPSLAEATLLKSDDITAAYRDLLDAVIPRQRSNKG